MALGVSSAVAANSPPAATTGTFATTGVEARFEPIVGDKPAVRAEGTETRVAVRPTPTTASAVTVDLGSDRILKKEDMNKYPITGPDKFAKNIELQNEHAMMAKLSEIDETVAVQEKTQAKEVAKEVLASDEETEVMSDTDATAPAEPVRQADQRQEMPRVEDARTKDRILEQ